MGPIKHLFVLMLENRSFDHMLGFSGIAGINIVTPGTVLPGFPGDPSPVAVTSSARDRLDGDPPHEYCDVQRQLTGPYSATQTVPGPKVTMQGFLQSGHADAIQCFDPKELPVLTALAKSYAVCDKWFSSMPGPTWPNRFFVHAGSSGGLDNSPSNFRAAISTTMGLLNFEFEHGTIFDRLNKADLAWRIYHGDRFPQVLAIDGMVSSYLLDHSRWRKFDRQSFSRDLADDYAPTYTFIEPDYDSLNNMRNGDSQHPTSPAANGEQLIKDVYDAISSSPIWTESVLLITYDEHGGFYDHVPPPKCTAPGDAPLNHHKAQRPCDCRFDRFGVRVPAVVISPWIEAGTKIVDPTGQERAYDHTSVISTLREMFPVIGGPLTHRDRDAPDFAYMFSKGSILPLVRTDRVQLSLSVQAAAAPPTNVAEIENDQINNALNGYLYIARSIDLQLGRVLPGQKAFSFRQDIKIETTNDANDYLQQVADKLDQYRSITARGEFKSESAIASVDKQKEDQGYSADF